MEGSAPGETTSERDQVAQQEQGEGVQSFICTSALQVGLRVTKREGGEGVRV